MWTQTLVAGDMRDMRLVTLASQRSAAGLGVFPQSREPDCELGQKGWHKQRGPDMRDRWLSRCAWVGGPAWGDSMCCPRRCCACWACPVLD